MSANHRFQLAKTVYYLEKTHELLFEQIINLSMAGEYRELQSVFEVGDTFEFSMEHFDDMQDADVNKLRRLCKKSEKMLFHLIEKYQLTDEEVEEARELVE